MRRLICFAAALLVAAASLSGQDRNIRQELQENPLRYGGSSSPYEYAPGEVTAPPEGFKPFHISHFGRHGSRFHTSKDLCAGLLKVFRKADSLGVLTALGASAYCRIQVADSLSRHRSGDLTPVGEREQREIAARMLSAYPEVFQGKDIPITARSTTSARVLLSMASFCEEIRSRCPQARIVHEAGDRTNAVLNHYTPNYRKYYENGHWRAVRDRWTEKHFHSDRMVYRLFRSADVFDGKADGGRARRFVRDLYSLAKILPAYGAGLSLTDLFPEEDLFVLWQIGNMEQYMRKGPSALAPVLAPGIAAPLLKDFLERADEAVSGGPVRADLRFGHGEGIMPLAALMQLEGASDVCDDPDRMAQVWQDYRITTMAANIQWVFYRNAAGEVLVHLFLNEREVRVNVPGETGPYYRWDCLKAYYTNLLEIIAR